MKILDLMCHVLQGTCAVLTLMNVYQGRAKMEASALTMCMATGATAVRISWVIIVNFRMMCVVLFRARTMVLV
jgi:2,3-bisphosphoglycerate-independent phosphoglycerate mutase